MKSVTTTDDKLEDAPNAPGTTPIKEVDFHKVILVHGYIINIVDSTKDNNEVLGRWWQKSVAEVDTNTVLAEMFSEL